MMFSMLLSDSDFRDAIENQLHVTVWMHGTILDKGGIIEKFDSDKVKIAGMYYVRDECDFEAQRVLN